MGIGASDTQTPQL